MGLFGGITSAISSLTGGILGGGKPDTLQQGFITPRMGDIPIQNPLPFLNPLFNIAGQNLSQVDTVGDIPEGSTYIGSKTGLRGGSLIISSPFAGGAGDPTGIDKSFITDPSIQSNIFGDLFDPSDLRFPDIPSLPGRIEAPSLPGALNLPGELTDPSFGTSQAEDRLLAELIEKISGVAGLRGTNLSPEGAAQTIAPSLVKFRGERADRLLKGFDIQAKMRADTIQGLSNIYGTEVGQRADDISRDVNLYNIQTQKVTSLRNKKAELTTQLEKSRLTAETARQTLETQLEIAQLDADLRREELLLNAANSLAQLSQGTAISGIGGGKPGLLETLGPIIGAGMGIAACWIAAALYGRHSFNFILARSWIMNHWSGRLADIVRKFYIKYGERIADLVSRYSFFDRMARPLFDKAIRLELELHREKKENKNGRS